MVKGLNCGSQEIKSIYHQSQRVYPNIVDQQTGFEYTDWVYNLPERTRTATPWIQDVYSDGSLGNKVLGTPQEQIEIATREIIYGTWDYTINTANASRTRTVTERFQFSDIAKDESRTPETENGARSQGSWTYDWMNSKRNATITYKFSDDTKTTILTENGTVSYNFTITPANTTAISAAGGSKSISATGSIDKKWNNTIIVSTTATVTRLNFSGTTPAGFTISGLNVNAANRGTVVGAILTASVYGVATVDNRILNSTIINVEQAANIGIISGSFSFAYATVFIDGKGGTVNNDLRNINIVCKYSNGSSKTLTSSEYNSLCSITAYTDVYWASCDATFSTITVSAGTSDYAVRGATAYVKIRPKTN
ncbi:MAG: hypothetical protein LIP01_13200, partial [Tannerellaceae bacterium]|nr:hypothetical protein [Tannerellaceae bacterium]